MYISELTEDANDKGIKLRSQKCLREPIAESFPSEKSEVQMSHQLLETDFNQNGKCYTSIDMFKCKESNKKIPRNFLLGVPRRSSKRLNRCNSSVETSDTSESQSNDIYEFNEEDSKIGLLHPSKNNCKEQFSDNVIVNSDQKDGITNEQDNMRVKSETPTAIGDDCSSSEIPNNIEVHHRQIEKTPEKCGGLKLTLRMKRSPVLDEVIESGNSLSEDSYEPEYEVLRVEGVDSKTYSSYAHRKKRHKSKDRKRDKKMKQNLLPPSNPPPMKRLKLIFGNESHTIDIPSTSTH